MAVTETPAEHEDPSATRPVGVEPDAIRRRAYEISQHDDAGSPDENWYRAEAELEAARAAQLAIRRPIALLRLRNWSWFYLACRRLFESGHRWHPRGSSVEALPQASARQHNRAARAAFMKRQAPEASGACRFCL